jgi:hypothetical protein
MIRVGDLDILCPICGKPDWCLVDLSGKLAICARVESKRFIGEAGWLHKIKGEPIKVKNIKKSRPTNINWQGLNDMYRQQINVKQQWKLKQNWSVRWKTLERLEVGWDGQAYTFPAKNECLEIVGMQRIFPDGSKRMVNGSKIGVIVPFGLDWQSTIFITEGISDTVVATDLNLNAIGRLSCACGNKILTELITDTDVVIIADADEPGIKGAKKLRKDLQKHSKYGIIYIVPESEDLRTWRDEKGNEKLKQFFSDITFNMREVETKK